MMLEEENSMLKAKCKRVGELEDKVEMVLKQNSQLLSENERLSKLLHQKKQEHEILKEKFESQSSQKLAYATDFEQERRKLIMELEQLEGELREIEQVKNAQISELKTQFQLELQTVKRQTVGSHEIYEQEIRKLRDQLDKKDYEVGDAVNRLKRFSSEAEYDILRLKEEKEKLRSELVYVEADKKKELEAIRSKLEANYLEEVESVKKSHLSSLEGFESENNKLKDLLDNKNIELEQLSSRLNKQKNNYEDTIAMTKRENEMLRNKMIEYERLSESEKDTLKVKLNRVHESEIEEMRINQQKYTDCLQNEIYKLETALNKKNAEIEQLIKEKTNVRQMFDSEGGRLKEEIDSLVAKIRELEGRQAETVSSYEEKLKEKSKHIDYLDRLNQEQQENNENEVRTIKQLLEHTRRELESEVMKKREREQDFQETIEDLKNDNVSLKEALSRERSDREKQVEDLQYELESQITTLKSKADTLASRNSIVERELIAIKETIVFKEKEIRSLQERVRVTEEREKKLERENDDLRSKLIKKDQKTNEMLNEQKQRLEVALHLVRLPSPSPSTT